MAYFLILTGVLLRLLPHAPNFAPIAALGLFGGTYLTKKFALIIPLAALFLSDILIGFYALPVMLSVYGSFILIGLLGLWLSKNKTFPNVVGASIIASILFYLITNFAVWAFTPWYSKDLAGLISCYFLALPFFRNTLLGDLFYVGVLFGLYETVSFALRKYQLKLRWLKV